MNCRKRIKAFFGLVFWIALIPIAESGELFLDSGDGNYKLIPVVVLQFQHRTEIKENNADTSGFLLLPVGLIRWIPTVTGVEEIKKGAKELEKEKTLLEETNRSLLQARQKAEDANRLKSEFLNTTSHELRLKNDF